MGSSMLTPNVGQHYAPSTWGPIIKESLNKPNDLLLTTLGTCISRKELNACASSNATRLFPPHLSNKAFI